MDIETVITFLGGATVAKVIEQVVLSIRGRASSRENARAERDNLVRERDRWRIDALNMRGQLLMRGVPKSELGPMPYDEE